MTKNKALFQYLNAFFDQVYLITLKKSKERHIRIKKVLHGLNYEIFWGVDGEQLTERELQEKYDERLAKLKNLTGNGLTVGEIGCALSHINIYKDILNKGYNQVLILEDDLIVNTDNAKILSKALNELPSDWELLYLGYLYNNERITLPIQFRIQVAYPLFNMLGFKKYNANLLRCKFPRSYSENLELSGYHYGTHAYAVTASGIKKIIQDQTPVSMAPDNAFGKMCMEGSLKAFRLKQIIFSQDKNLPTTILDRYEVKPD